MKPLFTFLAFSILLFNLSCQSEKPVTTDTQPAAGELNLLVTLESRFVTLGFTAENSSQSLRVYLPADYYRNKDRRYPVVYFFHGFSGDVNTAILVGPVARTGGLFHGRFRRR